MAKYILLMIVLFFSNVMRGQIKDSQLYYNLKEFYAIEGISIDAASQKELEESIKVVELVKNLNSKQISMYSFCFSDSPFNIIIVENDSVDIYDIHLLNYLLRRVIGLSEKYEDVSMTSKVILWIDKILFLNRLALDKSIFTSWNSKVIKGKYTYHFWESCIDHRNESKFQNPTQSIKPPALKNIF